MVSRKFLRSIAALLVIALGWLAPTALLAAETELSAPLSQNCFIGSQIDGPITPNVANLDWECSDNQPSMTPDRTIFRFQLDQYEGSEPLRYFATRRSPLEAVHVGVLDADGTWRSIRLEYGQIDLAMVGTDIKFPLPDLNPQSREVFVAIDMPTHDLTLANSRLTSADPGEYLGGIHLLMLLSALCGALLMPLFFNAAFYRVLRQPFVLWHAVLALSLLSTISFTSQISVYFVDLSYVMVSKWSVISLGISVAAGGMFAHSFIEPGRMHPVLRNALPWAAAWSILLAIVHANFPFVARAWQSDAYYLAYLPVLILYVSAIANALVRGSRAAKFQLAGWSVLILVCAMRIAGQLTPLISPTDAMVMFYIGCSVEVAATALGVADRFMAIKHQRDNARTEAAMLERISECDALTGLYNRRALEDRFAALRSAGFTTLTVLDLDHFKRINDEYGHSAGDNVLKCVSTALRANDDTMAFRVGGEEFVLLLRGKHTIERAEARRMAITEAVARSVSPVRHRVTASMGVVEAPQGALADASFEAIYERADRLLYEAKANGRNRTMSEKLKVFRPRKDERRAAA